MRLPRCHPTEPTSVNPTGLALRPASPNRSPHSQPVGLAHPGLPESLLPAGRPRALVQRNERPDEPSARRVIKAEQSGLRASGADVAVRSRPRARRRPAGRPDRFKMVPQRRHSLPQDHVSAARALAHRWGRTAEGPCLVVSPAPADRSPPVLVAGRGRASGAVTGPRCFAPICPSRGKPPALEPRSRATTDPRSPLHGPGRASARDRDGNRRPALDLTDETPAVAAGMRFGLFGLQDRDGGGSGPCGSARPAPEPTVHREPIAQAVASEPMCRCANGCCRSPTGSACSAPMTRQCVVPSARSSCARSRTPAYARLDGADCAARTPVPWSSTSASTGRSDSICISTA